MTDDELQRRLRDARPDVPGDDWVHSNDGRRAWAQIQQRVATGASADTSAGRWPRLTRALASGRGRLATAAVAGLAAAAVVVGLAVTEGAGGRGPARPEAAAPVTDDLVRPAAQVLSEADSCEALLDDLRKHARRDPQAYQRAPFGWQEYAAVDQAAPLLSDTATAARDSAHSTTNVQELGVDEPDMVKSDGDRIVSLTGGTLRITRPATREVTGSLDLRAYNGSEGATLLVDGDRALVLLGSSYDFSVMDRVAPIDSGGLGGTTLLVVDLTDDRPRVVETLQPGGSVVDARLVDGQARVVVASTSALTAPRRERQESRAEWRARWAAKVDRTAIDAWLPSYTVASAGAEDDVRTVPCEDVGLPDDFSGAELSTIYSVDLSAEASTGFGDLTPVTVVGDGSVAYASAESLYLTSTTSGREPKTEIHRFAIGSAGAPTYLGSGSVPGWLRDSYALSEADGVLRLVTTGYGDDGGRQQETSVRTLDAETLVVRGVVGGLGRGEDVYGVRYVGPYVYLVTFRQIDPLYVVDLSDPDQPVASGELKVTGYSDYLHLVDDGTLLGIGASATKRGRVNGGQVSLFDVADPSKPSLLTKIVKRRADTSDVTDPHAFLWWEGTRTAFVPVRPWAGAWRTTIVAVQVDGDELRELGTLRNPEATGRGAYDGGILRTLVIGDEVWTLSTGGLQASGLDDLEREAWIAFG